MANISKPNKLNLMWASGGDILDPGDTKYQTGWGVEVPPRQWENYIQNKQDQAIAHINQHGIAVWDAETEYQANTSYTQGQTNGTIYRAKVTHSGQNPELDTLNTYWDIAFAAAGDFYTKAEVDADFLAKDQNLSDLLSVTDARTNLGVYSKAETYTKTEVDAKTTVASALQAQEQVSDAVLLSPAKLAQAFLGSNRNTTSSGYQKFPGGLILQWVYVPATDPSATSNTMSVTFPIEFPNAALSLSHMEVGVAANKSLFSYENLSSTGVTVHSSRVVGASTSGCRLQIIGY
jgi:hypothetical protein